MSDDVNRDDAFAEGVAKPLRAEERVDGTFEARVMSGVHAIARAERARIGERELRSWWLRPRTISLTPVAGLAAAAVVIALLVLGASATRRSSAGSSAVAGRITVDTVHLVRFVLVDSSARSVSLVGSFNGWEKRATPLRPSGVNGVWTVSVPLSVGRHEYAFIVSDGRRDRWLADPMNAALHDDFDTESSVILVGDDLTT